MCWSHFKWPDSEVREIRDAVSSDSRFIHEDLYRWVGTHPLSFATAGQMRVNAKVIHIFIIFNHAILQFVAKQVYNKLLCHASHTIVSRESRFLQDTAHYTEDLDTIQLLHRVGQCVRFLHSKNDFCRTCRFLRTCI